MKCEVGLDPNDMTSGPNRAMNCSNIPKGAVIDTQKAEN